MRDTELLRSSLKFEALWDVTESILHFQLSRIDICLVARTGPATCSQECAKHDHREPVWRDLDLWDDQLLLHELVKNVAEIRSGQDAFVPLPHPVVLDDGGVLERPLLPVTVKLTHGRTPSCDRSRRSNRFVPQHRVRR